MISLQLLFEMAYSWTSEYPQPATIDLDSFFQLALCICLSSILLRTALILIKSPWFSLHFHNFLQISPISLKILSFFPNLFDFVQISPHFFTYLHFTSNLLSILQISPIFFKSIQSFSNLSNAIRPSMFRSEVFIRLPLFHLLSFMPTNYCYFESYAISSIANEASIEHSLSSHLLCWACSKHIQISTYPFHVKLIEPSRVVFDYENGKFIAESFHLARIPTFKCLMCRTWLDSLMFFFRERTNIANNLLQLNRIVLL